MSMQRKQTGNDEYLERLASSSVLEARTPTKLPIWLVASSLIGTLSALLTYSVLERKRAILTQLETSRHIWPMAHPSLEGRYTALNSEIIKTNLVEQNHRMKEWPVAYERFCNGLCFDEQASAALELEFSIRDLSRNDDTAFILLSLSKPSVEASSEHHRELLSSEFKRLQLERDFLGQLTKRLAGLDTPKVFVVEQ